jgi:hypothetical protein
MTPNNQISRAPFLRTSRTFPEESQPLAVETNKSYVDIANAVNARVIGLFTSGNTTVTGEAWFMNQNKNQKQQSLRQLYEFTTTAPITHNISSFEEISPSTRGSYTDGTNWYGLPFGTSVAVAGLITFYVTATQILFNTGAGAPALISGMIVLEWLSQV